MLRRPFDLTDPAARRHVAQLAASGAPARCDYLLRDAASGFYFVGMRGGAPAFSGSRRDARRVSFARAVALARTLARAGCPVERIYHPA